MHLDVSHLRDFYYRTRLGRAAQRAIRDRLVEMWSDTRGQNVVGFGFAVPLLRPFLADARRVIALMPAPQGVMAWPSGQPNISVLCEDSLWPLATGSVDRLVMLHGLETSENPSAVLDEAARSLGPGGSLVIAVPNRAGLWARSDQTPFGYGRPYSLGQMEAQLDRHGFKAVGHEVALFQPPSHRRFWLRAGPVCERIGQRVSSRYAGGVLMVEAHKDAFRPTGSAVRDGLPDPIRVLGGLSQPARGAARGPVARVHCADTRQDRRAEAEV